MCDIIFYYHKIDMVSVCLTLNHANTTSPIKLKFSTKLADIQESQTPSAVSNFSPFRNGFTITTKSKKLYIFNDIVICYDTTMDGHLRYTEFNTFYISTEENANLLLLQFLQLTFFWHNRLFLIPYLYFSSEAGRVSWYSFFNFECLKEKTFLNLDCWSELYLGSIQVEVYIEHTLHYIIFTLNFIYSPCLLIY